jgi:hypothetical protein
MLQAFSRSESAAVREKVKGYAPKYDLNGTKNKNNEKYALRTNLRICTSFTAG